MILFKQQLSQSWQQSKISVVDAAEVLGVEATEAKVVEQEEEVEDRARVSQEDTGGQG